ncbi:MAG: FprA family A-type flavoprotein [Oscillospiraceae bacterium]|nr:FprA family A-type flavoprotein [Oscillospiraceae bacterium]
MKKLTDSIYYCGVLNPNMRVFDVIMRTEYGTSYNSYIVRGSEKTAIVEAAHRTFSNSYIGELEEFFGDTAPDYLVLNHTEPDHTGCVAALVTRWPGLTVVCSRPASVFIKAITNMPELAIQVVAEGDELDLGGRTLKFFPAMFLHWPDSMFTWVPEENALFTCDFLGAHYCEPLVLDSEVVYENAYLDAAKYYYECIFGPFPSYVRAGLEIIRNLDVRTALTSHGPVLTRGNYLECIIEAYGEWSAPVERTRKSVPIFYCTAYRNTQRLAEAVREGVLRALPDADVGLYNIIEHDMGELAAKMNGSDAFLIGTITINRDAVPPVMQLLTLTDSVNIGKRPVAVFGTYGWSGEGFPHVAERLQSVGCRVYDTQFKVNFVPTDADIRAAADFGEQFAKTI